MRKLINLTGKRFGKWTVIKRAPNRGNNRIIVYWFCRCDCGQEAELNGVMLRSGKSIQCRSCSHTTHGMTGTKIFQVWRDMIHRCSNPKNKWYKRYGGRGITVCNRWMKIENFYADVGNPPKGKSLDRYPNPDGNYEPTNWRWATPKQQRKNQNRS